MIIFEKERERERERESKRALLSLIVFYRSHQSLFLLSGYRGTKGMHYYNWGTGDKYYNSGNRRYILQQGEQRMYYYKKGLGDALLQHWERDKYYNRGNRG